VVERRRRLGRFAHGPLGVAEAEAVETGFSIRFAPDSGGQSASKTL